MTNRLARNCPAAWDSGSISTATPHVARKGDISDNMVASWLDDESRANPKGGVRVQGRRTVVRAKRRGAPAAPPPPQPDDDDFHVTLDRSTVPPHWNAPPSRGPYPPPDDPRMPPFSRQDAAPEPTGAPKPAARANRSRAHPPPPARQPAASARVTTLQPDPAIMGDPAAARARARAELFELLRRLDPYRSHLEAHENVHELVEVFLDVGRTAKARFADRDESLGEALVERDNLKQAVQHMGSFGGDNRAGIDGTLHRISCMRNRRGEIIGLTCRVGKFVPGAAALVADIVREGLSVLILG